MKGSKQTSPLKKGGLRGVIIFALSMGIWALPSAAQQTPRQPSAAECITLADAVNIALKNNPTIEARQAMLKAASARVGMAKSMTGLQVSVASFATTGSIPMIVPGSSGVNPQFFTMTPDRGRLDGALTAMFPLYTGGKLGGQVRSAESLRQAESGELAASELSVALAAKTAYYQTLLASEFVDVFQQRVTESTERLRIAEEAYKEGRIAKYDLLRNQTDLAEAEQQLNNSQRDVEVALADLKNVLGASQDCQYTLSEKLTLRESAQNCENIQATALKQRPEVKSAQARVRSAQSDITVAKSAYKPQVYATAMAEGMTTSSENDSGYLVGVTAALPIFDNGLRKSSVDEAQAMLKQAEAELRDVTLGVGRDVSTSLARLQAAEKNVNLAKAAVTQAEEDYRVIKLRYEAGKAINVEVLDALASLTRAQTQHADALYNYNVAEADLLRAIGQK
ncbi:MAG: TolC family protein [Armatimonadota bacterium]